MLCPKHDWTVLSLPARYFSWRIRGNSLSWAFGERERLQQPYDLIIATSMVDLTSLRGFVPVTGSDALRDLFPRKSVCLPRVRA